MGTPAESNGLIKFAELETRRVGTPKIEALHRLIDWLNANVPNCKLPELSNRF